MALTNWGIRPMCAITGMPRATRNSTVLANAWLASSLTASQPLLASTLAQLRNACSWDSGSCRTACRRSRRPCGCCRPRRGYGQWSRPGACRGWRVDRSRPWPWSRRPDEVDQRVDHLSDGAGVGGQRDDLLLTFHGHQLRDCQAPGAGVCAHWGWASQDREGPCFGNFSGNSMYRFGPDRNPEQGAAKRPQCRLRRFAASRPWPGGG